MPLPTTERVRERRYRCCNCGHEHPIATNHYGEVYSRCPNSSCPSRLPAINACHKPPRHECLEPLPEGMARPKPWKTARLGDLVKVVR